MSDSLAITDRGASIGRLARRAALPAVVFVVVATAHFFWLGFFPEQAAGAATGTECTDEACCEARAGAPVASSSWMDRYVAGQNYWLGLSYGASLAFAAAALRRYRERRLCSARNLAIGSMSFAGVFAVVGCYLLGCCGSPMLGVYFSLFGAAFLPLAKPLVALMTMVSLGIAWWWMRRRERHLVAASACSDTHAGCEGA